MKIQMMALSKLKRYSNNPRRNAHAVAAVRKSLEDHGWRQPIVVDKKLEIIVGDTRYLAATEMGLVEVPVHVAADLTEAQVRAYRIADNKTGEQSEWDNEKLLIELNLLTDKVSDFTRLGFSKEELDKLMKDSYQPRELEDFERMPLEGERWILIRAPESQCALALNALKKLSLKNSHIEYSGAK